ncbi:hypothetical protein SAMN05720761_11090 [Fibrobacter sp. UWCM]|uniref:hypothetical protein n=1 Tax=Fibrobacter sp. UWCM TaxID=1896208 RepID=UPI000912D8D1|nr:hypothetical protein [Fibrobacter sp. UWCM]SHH20618.1 hypothetical protein SAMN05720761_11090 [Fibrobacter sp. UWCM]
MKKLFELLLPALLVACYSPEPFEAESVESASSGKSDIGTVFPVNTQKQICNPSVSQDTANYPAAMLWLNFGGTLKVTPPDSGFTTSGVIQHDRLTISDTSGKVLWYMMRDTSAGECQFQDPEWSTHADYAVALRAYDLDGKKACENLDYGIFAVRMSDSKRFWFYDKKIIETASPHLWVSPDASVDEDAADSTVEGFFGTDKVRLTYVNDEDKIVFVDFANGGLDKAKTLARPSGKSGWSIDAPMISPDGNFIVYNVLENPTTWEAYIQELSANSLPVKIERGQNSLSEPAQPHWFSFGGRLFVVWTEFPQGSQMLNKNDLTQESVQDGSVGRTVMREVRLNAGAPSDLAVEWVGDVREIASIPMIGGRSPDGRFLATGTNYGYLLELP